MARSKPTELRGKRLDEMSRDELEAALAWALEWRSAQRAYKLSQWAEFWELRKACL